MDNPKARYIRALVTCNFHLLTCVQEPAYMRCSFWKLDEFGRKTTYAFVFSGDGLMNDGAVQSAKGWARQLRTGLIIVSDTLSPSPSTEDASLLTSDEFFAKLGGQSPPYLVLQPEFGSVLLTSGKFEVPSGMQGKADTIFEEYVHAGLQFLLPARVIKYGQERLFEKLPDGIVLGDNGFNLIYDAKSAKNGYDVTSTTIRQFSDYVRNFDRRYGGLVGRTSAFLIVSASFQCSEKVMQDRSDELRGECGVGLCFLEAQSLSQIVEVFISEPKFRPTTPWKTLLSKCQLTLDDVQKSLSERRKDAIVT